jgi:hypothetical protein
MAKRSVSRPTENIALARIMAQRGKSLKGDPALLQKIIMDEVGIKYIVSCFHTKVDIPISQLWGQWQRYGQGHFVDFLWRCGIIYECRMM